MVEGGAAGAIERLWRGSNSRKAGNSGEAAQEELGPKREHKQEEGWCWRGRSGWSGYRRGGSKKNACGGETTSG